ncbi:MAG: Uma2 family endonuclease [Leptolyngbya sp. SIO4C1]|nr:Uma2 family endonuclease [Leptolyngbya sp. SIO4C1]
MDASAASSEPSDPYLWTVEDYHRLIKARLIGVNESVELVAGRIVRQAGIDSADHQAVVQRLRLVLQRRLSGQGVVRSQEPVLLGSHSELKPDIAVVSGAATRYQDHIPNPVEIALVIEVAEGSLAFDCYLKAAEYAEAGIPDYWVFDLRRQQLHVFRDILSGSYCQRSVLDVGESIQPLMLTELTAKLCPPRRQLFMTRRFTGQRYHYMPSSTLAIMFQAAGGQSGLISNFKAIPQPKAVVSPLDITPDDLKSMSIRPPWTTALQHH